MNEKRMEAITIIKDNAGVSISSPDIGFGEQCIYIPFEQVPVVIDWLNEMLVDDDGKTGESNNG